MMERSKWIKQEPLDIEEEEGPCRAVGPPKHGASPAQEATRARIASLEGQLRELKGAQGSFQIRCIEEELRKAHSKLRRLLNEAERQRRRRERLRGNGIRVVQWQDEGVMSALRSCTHFQDFTNELNTLGYTLVRNDVNMDENDTMPEVDGIKVQVELIEGDGELPSEIKPENSPSSETEIPLTEVLENQEQSSKRPIESYREWFERQIEAQHQWEERMMREQMELARSLLESVTTTFLQGIQQVISNVTAGRRFSSFFPEPPS
ncbi:uncharacterized protein LOC129230053 [Uloborus diversus]|uniref:uncharacterized protein LOC129230053 n=1 Tax=Uloborus diversus TaxID=327109 RepID=UPI002409D7F5|nr:uncharacterized protein LOC129230053 [Uloborus diversus]